MQQLKLEIDVNAKTFEKIQALSRLTGAKASELTSELSELIEQYLDSALIGATQEMLKNLGVDPSLVLPVNDDTFRVPSHVLHPSLQPAMQQDRTDDIFTTKTSNFVGFNMPVEEDKPEDNEEMQETQTVGALRYPNETKAVPKEETTVSDAAKIGAAFLDGDTMEEEFSDEVNPNDFGEGPDETEFSNMDPELDDEDDMKDFLQPGENVAIKSKDNKDTSFKDDFMNDIQDEFDDFEGDSEPAPAARVSKVSTIPNDVADGDLDILPQDFGLGGVTADKDATSFFMSAMSGKTGDKSKRNQIKKKILMPGDY